MAEIRLYYHQSVYMEDRGEHIVIGLRDDGVSTPLAEIGMTRDEFDRLWDAYAFEREAAAMRISAGSGTEKP